MKRILAILALCGAALGAAQAATDTVLLLHTNDLHDRIRASATGVGGMPYLSGYIAQARNERSDVLLLDAGDVMEKGDLLAFETKSSVMYEAMRRIGFHASSPGNHDLAYGLDNLRACARLAGFPLLSINLVGPDSKPLFEPSKIFDVDGVKVGVIGATTSAYVDSDPAAPARALDLHATVDLIAAEARALDPQCDLLVALCHLGSNACMTIADSVPSLDVIVGAHTHELLLEPMVAKKSGALIVQVGDSARYIGRLDMTIDLDEKRIAASEYKAVPLAHDSTPFDTELAQWAAECERAVCPHAAEVLGIAQSEVKGRALSRLIAQGLRRKSGAKIGLDSPDMLRGTLPAGPIDANAVFMAYVPAGQGEESRREAMTASISGADLMAYLEKGDSNRGTPVKAGGEEAMIAQGTRSFFLTDLDPNQTYSVALSRGTLEHFCAVAGKTPDELQAQSLGFYATDALAEEIEALTASGAEIGADEAAAALR